jgi:uncharacterized ferritin-like protein (DUF455 family)
MNPVEAPALAPGPARDPRFVVKDRWAECTNFPAGDPRRAIEFLHRQMNEEVDSLESSARNLTDFRDADWQLRLWLARQCSDEARHAGMFRRLFERRGGRVGDYPVMNFQYRIITRSDSLVGRLAIQNRSFEAGGIDAISFGIEDARRQGDDELVALFEAQLADEILHVRFANEFIRASIERDPRTLLRVGTALTVAAQAFRGVMGTEGVEGAGYPVAAQARQESGFTPEEIGLAAKLGAAARTGAP